MKIEDFGYSDFFESNRNKLNLGDFSVARVTSEYKGSYKIINQNGEYLAKITGKQMLDALSREDYPAVGDWVAITKLDTEKAVINHILPRRTIIKRKFGDKNKLGEKDKTQIIATNIDIAIIVESVNRDFSLNRLERYLAIVTESGIKPAIILNKVDLISEEELNEKVTQIKKRFVDVDVISTSTINNDGLEKLTSYITKGQTFCFLGSSGVGKSSLISKLLERSDIRTEAISSYSDRGRHITTNRQMYFLKNGGIVIDNPGMREVGIADAKAGVNFTFDEISNLSQKCKYNDCTHTNEPGCEVIAALETGRLDKDKFANYSNLKKEAEYHELTEVEKREKDRQFGKFLKGAKKDLRKR